MATNKTTVKPSLSLAIQESMMGRRRRLTERVTVLAQTKDRQFGRENVREFDIESRPSL